MNPSPKNVLMVTTLFPCEEKPYYCVFLLQLFEAVRHLGNNVSILIPDSAIADGEVVPSRQLGFNVLRVGYAGGLLRDISGIVSSRFSRRIKSLLETTKPDLVDIHFGTALMCKSVISATKSLNIPAVMHYHGLNVFHDYYVAHPFLEKLLVQNKVWIANNADGIVGVSNKVGQIVATKSKNKSVYTVYNGVDTDWFYPAVKNENTVFTVTCVANLIPIKGHVYLLRAVHNVLQRGHALKVRIIGVGPEMSRLQSLSCELGIENHVEFLGAMNYDAVAQEMRSSNFFVMPSYFESLGCVYLEAMASQVAVLGVRGCGIDEIIENRKNGYLADPHNAEQVADAILYAVENPEKHAQIALNGYKTVCNGYQWKHAASALDAVYTDILNRRTNHA